MRRGRKEEDSDSYKLPTIPWGTTVVHLPFKGFGNRQAERSSRALQSLVCGSQATLPVSAPRLTQSELYACSVCSDKKRILWLSEEG